MTRATSSVVFLTLVLAEAIFVGLIPSVVRAQRRSGPPVGDIDAEAQAQLQQAEQGETAGGRRATRGTARGRGLNTTGGSVVISPDSTPQSNGDGSAFPSASSPTTNEPKELISLVLWSISIEVPKAKAADDLVASLVQKTNDLPPVLSVDDVRILLGKLSVAGVLRRSRQFQLTTANGQAARTHGGATQPSVTNTTIANGIRTNSYTNRNIGTIVQVTPNILANGNIQVSLSYEASESQKMSPAVVIFDRNDGTEPTMAEQVVVQQFNTIVQLKRGSAMVVQKDAMTDPGNEQASLRTQLVILSASVLPPAE